MKKRILALLLVVFILSSCAPKTSSRSVFVMDSVAEIRLFEKDGKVTDLICDALYELDDVLSAYDGEVASINENGGGEMSPHFAKIYDESLVYFEKTGGAFSPHLGPVVELWGVGSRNHVPTESEIKAAVSSSDAGNFTRNGDNLELTNGARLNFGAIAKGYASDVIREILISENVGSALISLGGNIFVHGKKPDGSLWNVAIRDPKKSANDWLGSLALSDKFVISSGDYERFFEKDGIKYHHIMDTKTGRPAESDLLSVSVICESGAMGDALSTALYAMGKAGALDFWRENGGFELVLVGRDGVVTVTDGLAEVFTPNDIGGYSYETESK